MPPEHAGPDAPSAEGADPGEEPTTQVVESADLVEETTAARSHAPPPPPPSDGMGAPPEAPPAEAEPSETETTEVEELSADDLLPESVPAPPPDGVLEAAIAAALKVATEGGGARHVALYEAEIAALAKGEPDRARLALYQHEVGELLEDGGDEGAAVKAYAKALQSDATLKPNLWAIRRVFQRRALWPNLQKLLDAEIRFAKSDEERAELYVEKGQLLEDRLSQPEAARDCYLKATEVHPRSVAAFMALEKIYAQSGDLGGLAKVYRGLADATAEPGRKATLLLDLARLQESVEGGSLESALALCREAFEAGGDTGAALAELERLAEPAGRVEDLLWGLEARAGLLSQKMAGEGVAERIETAEALVAVRRRQAELVRAAAPESLEAGPSPDERAWVYLEAALQVAPSEPLLYRDLAELAEALGRSDELATMLQRRIESAPEPIRLALELERAEALRRAGKAAEAEAVEAEVARVAPSHLGLLVAREREALKAGDWDRLASLYLAEAERAIAASDPVWAATACTQAGTLLGDKSARDAEAEVALKRAIELRPGFALAEDALERLYARAGKPAELAQVLERRLAAGPSAAEAERLYEELIAAREVGLSDAAGAAQAARRLCELKPDDLRARLRLCELGRAAGRFAEVVEDLALLARLLPEERRPEVLLERAQILERRLSDDQAAAEGYKEVLALKPGESRAAEAFEALSRRLSGRRPDSGPLEAPPPAWDDLARALEREAQATLSPERASAVLLKLGEIHERERNSFADAARVYRDLLDRSPGHPAALRGLERALAALGDQAGRAAAMEAEIETLEEGSVRALPLTRLGELYEDRLGQDDQADETYGRALAAGASAHAALGRLRIAARKGQPQAIEAALFALARAEESAGAALLDERAWLARLSGDAERAAELTAEALGKEPLPPLGARLARLRLAARAGGGELGEAALELAVRAPGVGESALEAALLRRSGLLALAAGQRDAAKERLTRALELSPNDPETLVPICELGASPEALAARASLADGPEQIDWMIERGEALEAAGRLADAAREVSRALTADPTCLPAIELGRRLARAGGDAGGLAQLTQRLAACVQDAERAAALYSEAGAGFERLGLNDDAAAAYRAVLDRTPLDGVAFNRARLLYAGLYTERRQAGPLLELYAHRLAHVLGGADRVALHLERAEVLAAEGDSAGAERDLRAAIEESPEHSGAIRRLAELMATTAAGRAEALALLRRYLTLETGGEHRRAALLRMAELEEAEGGDALSAVGHLEEAIGLAPSAQASLPDRRRLAALYERLRQWQRAVDVLHKVAALEAEGAPRAQVEVRIASIYREGFSDPRAAIEALTRALKSHPLDLDAMAKLVSLFDAGHLVRIDLDDRLDRAIAVARHKAADHPLEAAPLRALVRLYGWRGDLDGLTIASQARMLVAPLDGAPPAREGGLDPSQELSPAGWERALPEAARAVALEIWRAAADASVKIYGPTPEALGAAKGDRVNPKAVPPGYTHVDKIARTLGCAGYELYALSRGDRELCRAAGSALVCGAAFGERLTPTLRFRAAYELTLVRDRLAPLQGIEAEELAVFFAACAKVAEVPRPAAVASAPEARVEERARAIGKALGRKERKALAQIGARFGELPEPWTWRRAILDGAARVALAVSGDLAAALKTLELDVHEDARARELLRFALSEDYLAIRREMGLKG